ncbi:MAG: bifunctional hydroxymethylpyrimidine kinase/phosphomethylpyrimidine kinase [Acidobacteria bacterium]|nr:bifunctional hydroxymethylpyrimidine kinase/phosphomethylpyrimidine kinase [Acidobacteriota bacterium]
MKPVALTIAGLDPSGGAGLEADLKTFHQFGVYGMGVLTLVTVQNTQRVSAVEPLAPRLVQEQLQAVLEDIPPQAAKTGALGTAGIIEVVVESARLFSFPLVVDPVMISKHGTALIAEDARQSLAGRLLPVTFLVTPNLNEAAALAGMKVADVKAMEEAARRIAGLGPKAVLVKGGHLTEDAVDVLYYQGRIQKFAARRIESKDTHGTGCTYSAAITAELAKGRELEAAIETAKRYITRAIAESPGLGRGCGPVDHHAAV